VTFAGTERFQIRRRIGAGAMGIVYEAFDRERRMTVALKTMRTPTPDSLAALKQELRALADIAHPNLVTLHELHAAADTWFVTMELIDGVDLLTYVDHDEARLRGTLGQLAQAIFALHEAGRLHRDIKPSNVLVTAQGRVVLLDFGAIAQVGANDRVRFGTPAYAAPEQARGEMQPASDWYALGVVMYQLLTGALPFTGSSRAIMYDKARYMAQPVRAREPDAPIDLASLCDALLRRDPEDRPTGEDVLHRLQVAPRRRWPRATDRDGVLVGREDALAVLRAAFADAERGRAGVVHVRGASGVGKSTLLDAFVRELARDSDAVVLASRCYPNDSVPYKAVDSLVDALARLLGSLPAADADAALPRDILLLAQVFPILLGVDAVARARRRRGPTPELHEVRRRAFAALRELVARLAEVRPIVLVIDDLQWGDVDSAAILDGLLATPDPPAVLVVLAYRDEDAPLLRALAQRRERLAGDSEPIVVSLGPLAHAEARMLAATLVGASDARIDAIATESCGVPFLIHELAMMVRDGVASIGGAVASRLQALPADDRGVLELVALAAMPIARDALAAASGVDAATFAASIGRLTHARLVRVLGGEARFECYHDRIREAVATALEEEHLRELHARLAGALTDHEALAIHCEGAGDRAAAAHHALLAAEQAATALAFERAAELYVAVLRLGDQEVPRREILIRLGDALANAGRGEEAADAYRSAAALASTAESLELRRRAASQYLRTGRIEAGLDVLAQVLAELGERVPDSPRRALRSLVWNRARLRLRRLARPTIDAIQIPPSQLLRFDTLWTAATDLGMIDLIVGADFATRQLLLALEIGEPTRIARALTTEAMFLAAQGARTAKRAEAALAVAEQLIADLEDPELPAWVSCARGLIAFMAGDFAASYRFNEAAVRILREDCTNVLWQVGGVEIQVAWAQFYRGKLADFSRRIDAGVELARVRGNCFDAANFGSGIAALAWAVADRTARGRVAVAQATAAWTPRGFHLQHYYSVLALASFDLYDGDARTAYERIAATWPELRRSHLMICQSVAIEAYHLRGRAAIAVGNEAGIAESLRGLAAHEGLPWVRALRALVQAGASRDRDDAVVWLSTAEQLSTHADLGAFAAAARRRRGELTRDEWLVGDAERVLRGEGVRSPARFVRMLVPLRVEAE